MNRRNFLLSVSASPFALAHLWYDDDCCSGEDCEAVPEGGVEVLASGYRVKFRTKSGLDVDRYVPFTAWYSEFTPRIRPSGDARYHACIHSGALLCLYVPAGA